MKIPKEKKVQATTIPVNPKEAILLEKRVLHRVHTIHTAIPIHPGETIPMMFIIMMSRDDFADDWAEEFGGGNYDGGYDDAYDYWEENYGK